MSKGYFIMEKGQRVKIKPDIYTSISIIKYMNKGERVEIKPHTKNLFLHKVSTSQIVLSSNIEIVVCKMINGIEEQYKKGLVMNFYQPNHQLTPYLKTEW